FHFDSSPASGSSSTLRSTTITSSISYMSAAGLTNAVLVRPYLSGMTSSTSPINNPAGNTPPLPEENTSSPGSISLSDSSMIRNKSDFESASYSSIKPNTSSFSSREIMPEIRLNSSNPVNNWTVAVELEADWTLPIIPSAIITAILTSTPSLVPLSIRICSIHLSGDLAMTLA